MAWLLLIVAVALFAAGMVLVGSAASTGSVVAGLVLIVIAVAIVWRGIG